jgi:hypothetical protein
MRKLIITAIAAITMTAAIGGGVALHRQSPAAAERAMMLNNLLEHSRTAPLWMPG